MSGSLREREQVAGSIDAVERRLVGLRRAETAALQRYQAVCAQAFRNGGRASVQPAELALADARLAVTRAEAAAEHWRARLR